MINAQVYILQYFTSTRKFAAKGLLDQKKVAFPKVVTDLLLDVEICL